MPITDTKPKFLSFWSINGELIYCDLAAQLAELKAAGLDGVVFHPRYYPGRPDYLGQEYMDMVSRLILLAQSMGMEFWLYDENGWPSGTAGGQVLERLPEMACQWLEPTPPDEADGPVMGRCTVGGVPRAIVLKSCRAVNSLDRRATEAFLDITHEAYRRMLDPQAFAAVEGFFSDEVGFLDSRSRALDDGGLPWSDGIGQAMESRFGSLAEVVPLLFGDGPGDADVRAYYWETVTDGLADGFYRPILEWCNGYGKRFAAHLKGEENLFFHLSHSGSAFQTLRYTSLPAVDALERFPGNHFYPRIATSVAAQFGDGLAMAEAMGGAGWGVSPGQFVDYMLWLAGHGINRFVLHLNQYRLTTQAIHDWPPSTPCHLNWKDAFPAVLTDLKQRIAALGNRAGADTLLIVPTRGVMGAFHPEDARHINPHDGAGAPDVPAARISDGAVMLATLCHNRGIRFHLADERMLEQCGAVEGTTLRLGECRYKSVIATEGCLWQPEGERLLSQLRSMGLLADPTGIALPENRQPVVTGMQGGIALPQSRWTAQQPEENSLALEMRLLADGTFEAIVCLARWEELPELTLTVMETEAEVWADGQPLHRAGGQGSSFVWQPVCSGEHRLVIHLPDAKESPVAFVMGRFACQSLSGWQELPGGMTATSGPFQIVPPMPLDPCDMIATGLPFCHGPVRLQKSFGLAEGAAAGSQLCLDGPVHGDTALVRCDSELLGWAWGPEWAVMLPSGLVPGSHVIELDLISSTYNRFGPHHYIGGDNRIVSPGQYEGVRNFADRPEMPDATADGLWRFVRFGCDAGVLLEKA